MNEKYIIYGALAVAVGIIAGVVWYYRKNITEKVNDPKFKEFVHKMMLQAEEYFNSGEGQKKFEWVLNCAMTWLHLSGKSAEIAKEIVKTLIQEIFDKYSVQSTDKDGTVHTTLK